MRKSILIFAPLLAIVSAVYSTGKLTDPDKPLNSTTEKTSSERTPLQVTINWTMNPRFFIPPNFTHSTQLVMGYNRFTHKYLNEYVNPAGYGISLKTILHNPPSNLSNVSYRWEITGVTKEDGSRNNFSHAVTTEKNTLMSSGLLVPGHVLVPPSNSHSIPALPALGIYKIKVTVLQASTIGRTLTELGSIQQTITLKDYLIVALGDSFTSGEGNPDVRGISDDDFWCNNIKLGQTTNLLFSSEFDMKEKAVWLEPLAHRSFISPTAQIAKMLEDSDPHTSVTFLNFGCSGAKVTEGLMTPQHTEWQSSGQIDEAWGATRNRRIDAVIMSIGINDLGGVGGGISTLLEEASNPLPPQFFESSTLNEALKQVDHLPVLYAVTENQIKAKLKPRATFIYEIPVNIFRNISGKIEKPCGALSLIDLEDIIIIDCIAAELNLQAQIAALKFGWTYIGGVVHSFIGHGYCESPDVSWYRAASTSCKIQGDINGTIHPNEKGHQRIAELGYAIVKNILEQKNEAVEFPERQSQ